MKDKLELTKITGYILMADNDSGTSYQIKGYYKNENIALVDAKGAGSWGGDGKVEKVELYTDGENIYTLQLAGVGKFVDIERDYKDKTINTIKSKLTKEELELLGIK